MRRLYLQPHAFVCGAPDVVLLDLRTNRYVAIPEHQSQLLARRVAGWPRPVDISAADSSNDAAHGIVDELTAQGLLTADAAVGKDATPVSPAAALRTLVPQPQLIPLPESAATRRAMRRLPALLHAAVTATAQLRLHHIEKIVDRVIARRTHERSSDDGLAALVADFYWLRPFVFTGREHCLHHSLTLLHFLARFDHYPNWIFGVRKAPFAAHCWVQHTDAVLNDTPDRLAAFTPIMMV